MTYCVGMTLDEGLVLASDSRTNAGVDHISTYCKMRIWNISGDRALILMSAGNLAITQAVAAVLDQRIRAGHEHSLLTVDSLYKAALLVGEAVREVHHRDAKALQDNGVDFNVSLILGGQIKGEAPRLFLIYAAGNFIEATPETPYFQIGETKYGKPIIDRVVTPRTGLTQAAKCALLSIDSTIRSNVTVGLPIDLVIYRADSFVIDNHQTITEHDPYFETISTLWGQGLNSLFQMLPEPPWAG